MAAPLFSHQPKLTLHRHLIPRTPQQQAPAPPATRTAVTTPALRPTATHSPLADPAVRSELAIHGYAMLAAFAFMFPTMACLMRYGGRGRFGRISKHPPRAAAQTAPPSSPSSPRRLSSGVIIFLHAGSLALSSIVTALAACLALMNSIPCPSAIHRVLGPTIVVALIAQVLLGVLTFLRMGRRPGQPPASSLLPQDASEPLSQLARCIRAGHNVLGPLIIFFGFIQVPLGINMLYPFFQEPFAPMYIIYYLAVAWWMCVVAVCERRGVRQQEWGESLNQSGQNVGLDSGFVAGDVPGIEMVSGESASSKLLAPPSEAALSSSSLRGTAPRPPFHTHGAAASSSTSLSQPTNASSTVSPIPHHRPHHLPPAHNPTHAASVISHALNLASQRNLPHLSWSDLDTYVTHRGKLWVIGPGGLVLDISTWISTHPGGHKVLVDALGCNISVDFFNLPNFDKQRFRAYPSKPVLRPTDNSTNMSLPLATSDWACTSASGICSEIDPETCSPSVAIVQHRVTAEDWKHVLVARQTNVHSKSAIAKLSAMAVALVPEVTLGTFSKLEYRRYAMTSKTVLGGPAASTSKVSLGRHPSQHRPTTVQFTFTLLYPNETYLEEPTFFLPGHVVQLRLRLPGTSTATASSSSTSSSSAHLNQPPFWVTRYFTPLSGNMTHFSIAVKLKPGGLMSTLLSSLNPSHHRQIHIRGPFGSPIMNPTRPLPTDSGTFDHLVLLTAGSGVVSAVQLVGWYFTQTYFDLRVRRGYRPPSTGGGTGKDLLVEADDKVLIRYPMTGGWVWGTNVRTGVDGYIPLHALVPWIGTGPKVTVCVGERGGVDRIVGRDVLESAAGAYPAQVRLDYFVSHGLDEGGSAISVALDSGVTAGRMNRASVQHVLLSSGFLAALNTGRRACKVMICGPEGFVSACYEWVTDLVDDQHVWVLPPHVYFQGTGANLEASSTSREADARFAQVVTPSPPAALIPPRMPLAVGPGPVTLARSSPGNSVHQYPQVQQQRQVSFSPYTSPPPSSGGSPNNTLGSSVLVVGADGTRRMSSLAGLSMRRDRGSSMPEWLCVPSPVATASTFSQPVGLGSHHRDQDRDRDREHDREREGGESSARFVGGSGRRWK